MKMQGTTTSSGMHRLGSAVCLVALLCVGYIIYRAFVSPMQSSLDTYVEITLLSLIVAGSLLRRSLFGISRKGLPVLEDLNCEEFEDSQCRETCERIRELLKHLERSGFLRKPSRLSWTAFGLCSAIGGVVLAILTSTGLMSALGVSFCLHGLLDLLKTNPKDTKHWIETKSLILDLFAEFDRECVSTYQIELEQVN